LRKEAGRIRFLPFFALFRKRGCRPQTAGDFFLLALETFSCIFYVIFDFMCWYYHNYIIYLKKNQKNFKFLKKVLTKQKLCGIMNIRIADYLKILNIGKAVERQ